MISEKIKTKIDSADKRLNLLYGYDRNIIVFYIDTIIQNGSYEVGYRSQCGSTHITQKIYREFYKIILLMRKEGFEINEEPVKHGNRYATNNGGFWNSTIFKLIK